MSGPIVRKYGFPNFDKIFGERPLEHGVDDESESGDQTKGKSEPKGKKKEPATTKKSKPKES
jgi:hypothetical protein